MITSKEERKEMQQRLFRGDKSRIATACSVSRASVSRWFAGKFNSPKIETAVKVMLVENKKRKRAMQSRLQELLR